MQAQTDNRTAYTPQLSFCLLGSYHPTMALTVAHQRTFRPAAASRVRCVRVAAVHPPNKATSFVAAAAAALLVSWGTGVRNCHVLAPLLQEVNCTLTSALCAATAEYYSV